MRMFLFLRILVICWQIFLLIVWLIVYFLFCKFILMKLWFFIFEVMFLCQVLLIRFFGNGIWRRDVVCRFWMLCGLLCRLLFFFMIMIFGDKLIRFWICLWILLVYFKFLNLYLFVVWLMVWLGFGICVVDRCIVVWQVILGLLFVCSLMMYIWLLVVWIEVFG